MLVTFKGQKVKACGIKEAIFEDNLSEKNFEYWFFQFSDWSMEISHFTSFHFDSDKMDTLWTEIFLWQYKNLLLTTIHQYA